MVVVSTKGLPLPWDLKYQYHYCELSNEVLYASLPQGAPKLPEVKDLQIQIYLIEMKFFGNFNFDVWQFWRPSTKIFIEYLIWKLSLVVLIYIHAKCVAPTFF